MYLTISIPYQTISAVSDYVWTLLSIGPLMNNNKSHIRFLFCERIYNLIEKVNQLIINLDCRFQK
jgi:hypothetical protein